MIPEWFMPGVKSLEQLGIWWTTGIVGALLYWLPLCILVIHYTMKNISDIRTDKIEVCEYKKKLIYYKAVIPENKDTVVKPAYYHTNTTIGKVLGRYFVCLLPVVNLFLAVFDALGSIIDTVLCYILKLFNIEIIGSPNEK